MIAALLIPLIMSAPPEPIDPETEVMLVEISFDEAATCPLMVEVVPLLGGLLGDHQLALEMVVAYAVERFEDGYEANLTEEGEDRMIELLEECL